MQWRCVAKPVTVSGPELRTCQDLMEEVKTAPPPALTGGEDDQEDGLHREEFHHHQANHHHEDKGDQS